MKKEDLKEFLNLDKPILINALAAKIQPQARLIYVVLMGFLAILTLVALILMLSGLISQAIFFFIFIAILFVVFRMFCEFLSGYKK